MSQQQGEVQRRHRVDAELDHGQEATLKFGELLNRELVSLFLVISEIRPYIKALIKLKHHVLIVFDCNNQCNNSQLYQCVLVLHGRVTPMQIGP